MTTDETVLQASALFLHTFLLQLRVLSQAITGLDQKTQEVTQRQT